MSDRRIRVIALLLGIVFLAAQFHVCAEVGPAARPSHRCLICLSGAWALPAHSPDVSVVRSENRIEVVRRAPAPAVTPAYTIAPRAPPAA